jgi:hypothetical protein
MQIAIGIILVISVLVSAILGSKFRLSVKREAPQLYEKLWKHSFGAYSVRTNMVVPFAMMIVLRRYRRELANCPKSRAWASWMFANSWLQLLIFAVMIVATLSKRA